MWHVITPGDLNDQVAAEIEESLGNIKDSYDELKALYKERETDLDNALTLRDKNQVGYLV